MTPFLSLSRATRKFTGLVSPWTPHAQFLAAGVAFALGWWGWELVIPARSYGDHVSNLMRTLQLVTLQFPLQTTNMSATGVFTSIPIPWQLQLARVLLPAVTLMGSLHLIVGAATRPFRLALLPRLRHHIVVLGASQMTEAALLKLAAHDRRIVLLAPGVAASRRDTLESYGLTVVDAAPTDAAALRSLNIKDALAFIIAGPDELENLSLAALALSATQGRPKTTPDLALAVLLDREDVARELDGALDGVARARSVRYQRLCPDREGLRLELARHAPVFTRASPESGSHVLVVGLAGRWEQALAQIILATQDHPTRAPFFTLVVDETEARKFADWRAVRPDIDLIAQFEVLVAATGWPQEAICADLVTRAGPPDLVVVMREDLDAIAAALALRGPTNPLGAAHTPMLVRQGREDRLLAALGDLDKGQRDLTRMAAFGGLVREETLDQLLDRKRDEIPVALHTQYLESARSLQPGSPAALKIWDDLPENLREANRSAASHMPVLFASRGFQIIEASAGTPAALDSADIEWLARVEHRRWMADRIDHGWRSGSPRDDARLIHPSIVDYETLSDSEREKDRANIRALVEALARAGKILTRREHER